MVFARKFLAALAVLALLGLTGCLRLESDIVIRNDRDIGFTIRTGAKKDPKATQPQRDPCQDAQFQGGRNTPYDDGEYYGCAYEFTTSITGQKVAGLSITRHDGVYDVTWRVPAQTAQRGVKPETMTSFRVAVTFPGDVVAHNGSSTLEGRTVIWTDPTDWFAAEGLHATGAQGDSPFGLGFLWWAVPLAALTVALIVAAVVLVTRRGRAPSPQPGS